jgi:hypothetical protein
MTWAARPPGVYDRDAEAARLITAADGVLLLVVNGYAGDGIAVQVPADRLLDLPAVLRDLAQEIERQIREGS